MTGHSANVFEYTYNVFPKGGKCCFIHSLEQAATGLSPAISRLLVVVPTRWRRNKRQDKSANWKMTLIPEAWRKWRHFKDQRSTAQLLATDTDGSLLIDKCSLVLLVTKATRYIIYLFILFIFLASFPVFGSIFAGILVVCETRFIMSDQDEEEKYMIFLPLILKGMNTNRDKALHSLDCRSATLSRLFHF